MASFCPELATLFVTHYSVSNLCYLDLCQACKLDKVNLYPALPYWLQGLTFFSTVAEVQLFCC